MWPFRSPILSRLQWKTTVAARGARQRPGNDFFLACGPTQHTSLCVFSWVCVSIFHRPSLLSPKKSSSSGKTERGVWAKNGQKLALVLIYVSRLNVYLTPELVSRPSAPRLRLSLLSPGPIYLPNHPLLLFDHSHLFSLEQGIFCQPTPPLWRHDRQIRPGWCTTARSPPVPKL